MYKINLDLYKIKIGGFMKFTEIQPFVRYVHYLPLDKKADYGETAPYDNRLFFCCRGLGEITADGKPYTMRPGTVLIIPSGTPYHIKAPDNEITYMAVNFDYFYDHADLYNPIPPASVLAYNPTMRLEQIHFSDTPTFNGVIFAENLSALNESFTALHREYSRKLLFSDRILSGQLSEILFRCARATTFNESKTASETVSQLIDYIHENYSQNITNKTIAHRFNLHPNYVSNLIKAFTGMPLHRYIMHTRVSVSMQMLLKSNASITEIAEKCGFSDIYHFSKIFKKFIGVPPTKYNKNPPA